MKKFFLFAAAMFAAVSMNAQVINFADIKAEADYTVANCTKNAESTATKVIYDIKGGDIFTFNYKNVEATITNSANKEKIFAVALADYVEFGGKNGSLTIKNLKVGDKVTIVVANKSDKGIGHISATAGAVETDVTALPAKANSEYTWVTLKYTAAAEVMTLKEVDYGYRITTITIGNPSAIENNEAEVKAVKKIENGQVVILKNGVKYNVLGAEIK